MKSWPILLAVVLLALTATAVGNSDADVSDKDENQVMTRSADEEQEGEDGNRRFMLSVQSRFRRGMFQDVKEWTEKKIYKWVKKLIHFLYGDDVDVNDVSHEKIFKTVMDIMLNVVKDVWENREKPAKDIIAAAITSVLKRVNSSGNEAEKPVESDKP